MPKKPWTDQEVGFMRSFWDEVMELQDDFNGKVLVHEKMSRRPGVLEIRLEFYVDDGLDQALLSACAYQYTFPSSANSTYAASKWIAARALRQTVEDAAASLEKPRQRKGARPKVS